MTAFFERLLHSLRHLQLSAAKFIRRMGAATARRRAQKTGEAKHRGGVLREERRTKVAKWKPRSLYNKQSSQRIQLGDSKEAVDSYPKQFDDAPADAGGSATLAIVGRPNVGKSTLFNRIVGSRRAIVGDEPGITRDRLYGEANWRGRRLRIVDTGGIVPEEKEFIPAEIFRQAKSRSMEADAVVMVVDGRTELAGPDLELARDCSAAASRCFWQSIKLIAKSSRALMDEFHGLGIRKIFPVSAEHGRGVDDLLDAVLDAVPGRSRPRPGEHRTMSRQTPKHGHAEDAETDDVASRNQGRHHRPS